MILVNLSEKNQLYNIYFTFY